MVQEVSLAPAYDFVRFCNNARLVQVISLSLQILLVYSESANLTYLQFGFYMLLLGAYLYHVTRRWAFNIDGRYDLRQLMRSIHNTARVQYSIALFTAVLLSFLVFSFIELSNGIVHFIFYICSLTNVLASIFLLLLEAYEVFTADKQNKEKQK